MKRLTLIRHAKSSWDDSSLSDFDRPLNKRGQHDAPVMGNYLRKAGHEPDILIASPALRALTTAQILADHIEYPREEIREEPDIYEAHVSGLISIVRSIDDRHEHAFLVGHNPGFGQLANLLAGNRIDRFPTCAVADILLEIDTWAEAGEEKGTLNAFVYPKLFHQSS